MSRRVAAGVFGLVVAFGGAHVLAAPLTVVSEQPLAAREAYEQTLRSRITGREYRIRVWRPSDLPEGAKAPVLYVLDGEADRGTAAAVARLQARAFVVSIAPGDDPGGKPFQRYGAEYLRREFLHHGVSIPAQGGSPAAKWEAGDGAGFQRFLLEELKPLIAERHPDATPSALLGDGMAATFVLHLAADVPDAFKLYGAKDPGLDPAAVARLSVARPKASQQGWSVKLLMSWYTADHVWDDPERPIGEAMMQRGYQARWKNNLGWAAFVTQALVELQR